MLTSLQGLDHVVIMVHDLDSAAQKWRDLGFTVSPRGTHSAHLGTGNYTIMFDDDYVELLGVLTATEHNAPSRAFLDRRGDGLERAAFTTTDAQAGVDALAQRGITARGPIDFSRPVDLPDGGTGEAAFSVFHWPVDQRPADVRIFACQHRTRDTVWIPALMQHANTACGINQLDIIASDPDVAASQMAELIGGVASPHAQGVQVETGPGRAVLMFMTKSSFAATHNVTDNNKLPEQGAAAMVVRVRNLQAAAALAGSNAVVDTDSVTVPTSHASGVMVVFVQA